MASHPFPAHAYEHLLEHRDRIHELAELRHDVISRNLPTDDYVLSEIDNASRLCRVYDRCILSEWFCDSHCVRCGFATTSGTYCARCRALLDDDGA